MKAPIFAATDRRLPYSTFAFIANHSSLGTALARGG
jgi:hypothetical protein